jgi:hypothetical protein
MSHDEFTDVFLARVFGAQSMCIPANVYWRETWSAKDGLHV